MLTALAGGCATPSASGTTSESSAKSNSAYSGLGSESISPELLRKFAPPALPPELSRRVQNYLDVRSPGLGMPTPDGRQLFFGWSITGFNQVWRLDHAKSFPSQVTGGEDNTQLAAITPDGKWLVLSRDRNGEENPGLYLQSVQGGPLIEIQHQAKVRTSLQFVSDDSRYLYYRANDQAGDSYALYRYELATQKKKLLFGLPEHPGLWAIADHTPSSQNSNEGEKLLLTRETGALWSEWAEYDPSTQKLTPLFGQDEHEEYTAAYGAHPGELLVLTPKFGEFRRLYRWQAGKFTPVSKDTPHDVEAFDINHARTRVLLTFNDRGYSRVEALDPRSFQPLSMPALPSADRVTVGLTTPDGRFTTIGIDDGRNPRTSYVIDWRTRKLTQWVIPSSPEMDTTRFARAELGAYPARDGTQIPYFVRQPKQCADPAGAPCPVIVHFHGGPEGQTRPGFSPMAQIFVDAGFVFVEPNVRGSDGYGKSWIRSDDGPKRLQVITDIEDAAHFARAHWSRTGQTPPKVGIFGGSYGGYSVQMGMTMFAGAYDAGVSVVGMSNLMTFLMNTAPYRRILRTTEYGDPVKDKEALELLSPVHYLDKVKSPLLLIQGANDPRVPVGEAVQIHDALERKGVSAPLIVFGDEGHGSAKRSNKVLELGHALKFFQDHVQK